MVIVVPFLSENQEIYGVYSVCISILIFLSYADLGFHIAGAKIAAECYSRGEENNELELLGFVGFILLIVTLAISVFFAYCALNPQVIIGKTSVFNTEIARRLFLIMVCTSPFIAVQKIVQTIFSIRIKDYIWQIINIIGNILKIASVFLFFFGNKYDIVSYFLTIQLIPIVCTFISLIYVKKNFKIRVLSLFKNFKWNKFWFSKTKDLAQAGLASTISWVLFYELDQLVIAQLYGANSVALFAVAFSILNYIRMFLGAFFSPFNSRFAHFYAYKDLESIKSFYIHIIRLSFPIVVIPIVTLFMFSKQFIIAWAGHNYIDSTICLQLFIIINIFAFIIYPSGSLLIVLEKNKLSRKISLFTPILYWLGILSLSSLELNSFPIMKLVVFVLQAFIITYIISNSLSLRLKSIFLSLVKENAVTLIVVLLSSILLSRTLHIADKSFKELILVILIIGLVCIIGFASLLIFNKYVRNYVNKLLNKLLNKPILIEKINKL